MPLDEIAAEAADFVVRQVGGLVVEVAFDHIFSRHTARFFHGVGRRTIRIGTLGQWHIPSSLRAVPKGEAARPEPSDWVALVIGVLIWIALFIAIGMGGAHFL
ncbi:hypothetical protein SAMIE_1027940 [Sphingobium amiense]|uniref:Uncharacterized protein n=1 Tax=Sphingobium amiense TaxID=135719 RepID=A0A494W3W5_9SPHN|nr:hypothetical protein [Sphingobium amiense]BBD99293.1 hypothetical protein SAMIE_1027940 [Sphingobium amiense]